MEVFQGLDAIALLGAIQFGLATGAHAVQSFVEIKKSRVCPKPWETFSGVLLVSNILMPISAMALIIAPLAFLGLNLENGAGGLALLVFAAGFGVAFVTMIVGDFVGQVLANAVGYEF